MRDRPTSDSLALAADVVAALRPLIDELVAEAIEQQLAQSFERRESISYLTTAEYADRFKSTPGAVLARINRGTLQAIRPAGAREWLIPVQEDQATIVRTNHVKPPRRGNVRGRDTEGGAFDAS